MSDDSQPPSITAWARTPFDDADADIILRTSDNVDFYVFRSILTLSSPFFKSMFSLPQPKDTLSPANDSDKGTVGDRDRQLNDGAASQPLPINIPEDSLTLDTLLRFLYPNTHIPSFRNMLHARDVAITAAKYDMPTTLDRIADKIQAQYAASQPLYVYFIACRMGWEGVAGVAAKYCLDSTLVWDNKDDDRSLSIHDLLDFPGAAVAYHWLATYREACCEAIRDRFAHWQSGIALPLEDQQSSANKGCKSHNCLTSWTLQYLFSIAMATMSCPLKETLDDCNLIPEELCKRCSGAWGPTIANFQLEVKSWLEEVHSEVQWVR